MLLNINESEQLIKKHGIEFAKAIPAKNEKELKKAMEKIGFPLVMKIISSKIVHKTDTGGVITDITDKEHSIQAFKKMKKLKGFDGVLIQEMLEGHEIIIGGKQDPQFGPTILFGMGGIFVELYKDVSLRICPITRKDAKEMIKEIKGYKILKGYRGQKGTNLKKIEDYLMIVSKMMETEDIKELDLNPLIATEKTIKAIDARIVK